MSLTMGLSWLHYDRCDLCGGIDPAPPVLVLSWPDEARVHVRCKRCI